MWHYCDQLCEVCGNRVKPESVEVMLRNVYLKGVHWLVLKTKENHRDEEKTTSKNFVTCCNKGQPTTDEEGES